jgi:hypothetical protein
VSGYRPFRPAVGVRAALAGACLSLLAAPAPAQDMTEARFASLMDTVFGHGAWRMTGGYRTPEREDELRAQGAMTVRPAGCRATRWDGERPGAYDLVVDGMSPSEAAERLRKTDAPFARYQPKGAHGTQGPHLHLEPYGFGPPSASQPRSRRHHQSVQGAGRPCAAVTIIMPAPSAGSLATARGELSRLRASASQGSAEAQLELGRIYALGYLAQRDFAERGRGWSWPSPTLPPTRKPGLRPRLSSRR